MVGIITRAKRRCSQTKGRSPSQIVERAKRKAFKNRNAKIAEKLLLPLVRALNAEALFIYSQFSIRTKESAECFERRSVTLLRQAADLDYAPALYALGVCYDSGDLVEKDSVVAAGLFERAAALNYPEAKLSHGLNLVYGTGTSENRELGIDLIRQAVQEGVDGAYEYLADLLQIPRN
jgi:TPR repeat protein